MVTCCHELLIAVKFENYRVIIVVYNEIRERMRLNHLSSHTTSKLRSWNLKSDALLQMVSIIN